eukprot:CAMPEP_0206325296 /NCGR_PEP_ID=MMETSP0106_2-20121207/20993_1 /ASSEMBLY_ACC=CAM_ASM_000206 /TAXON_ID=81532 /ORGANISM="Acanthoeca-like sp., Strain 10tr" /LENGTH=116 /DNA_ID=CAMNT_0053757745 /DNA_START=29 /DNA_END=375 /DNA_ORIENTATION=+
MFLASSVQGWWRFRANLRAPEDAWSGLQGEKDKGMDFARTDKPADAATVHAIGQEQRWTRIVANDLENIPIGLVVAWASALVAKDAVVAVHLTGLLMFGVGRLSHTVCYAIQSSKL